MSLNHQVVLIPANSVNFLSRVGGALALGVKSNKASWITHPSSRAVKVVTLHAFLISWLAACDTRNCGAKTRGLELFDTALRRSA